MKIAVVSDTHGQTEFTREAVSILKDHPIEQVLHCGDIGAVEIVNLFEDWPTRFVFGNVDQNQDELKRAISDAGQTCDDRFGEVDWAGRKIAYLHGDDFKRLRSTVAAGCCDLVCHGHTHVPRWEKVGRTMVLNPGALFRAARHTVAIVDLDSLEAEHIAIN